MENPKTQLVERLKTANNVLISVSRNPSVDQLSAMLGLSLFLNKLDKHGAAVFSGKVPPAIEFLQPEAIIEKNTDSLRDFIIALDKSKADKLRYKVEDDVVRIFITPYRTSISEDDFNFSQGDFNVDVVVALGVQKQEDLDEAITAHGRILHDATVASINVTPGEGLGSIVWNDAQASSLSELVTELAQALAPDMLDAQNATALLTGIVAETDRFSNQKTTSFTMSASAALMAAGADQQLVATKLNEPEPEAEPSIEEQPEVQTEEPDEEVDQPAEEPEEPPKPNDGTIEIEHDHDEQPHLDEQPADEQPTEEAEPETQPEPEQIDEPVDEAPAIELPAPEPESVPEPEMPAISDQPSSLVTEAPTLGGTLTASAQPEALDPSTDPFSMPATDAPMLTHDEPATPIVPQVDVPVEEVDQQPVELTPPPAAWTPPAPENVAPAEIHPPETLSDIEASVDSPHRDEVINDAQVQVEQAIAADPNPPLPEPVAALNAQPLGGSLHGDDDGFLPGFSSDPDDASAQHTDDTGQVNNSQTPPPVPPPLPPQFLQNPPAQQ